VEASLVAKSDVIRNVVPLVYIPPPLAPAVFELKLHVVALVNALTTVKNAPPLLLA